MILRESDVRRARITPDGGVELEFAPPPVQMAPEPAVDDYVPPAPTADTQPSTPTPAGELSRHPGYARLFAGEAPAFIKPTNS